MSVPETLVYIFYTIYLLFNYKEKECDEEKK